jgi:hypothetical protein
MAQLSYPECIRELYESEIMGEALTLALVAASRNDRESYHNATLLQLETETKAGLRPFLFKSSISLSEEVDLSLAEETVAGYRNGMWLEFMQGSIPIVQQFLDRFKEIAVAGPAEDQDVLQSMIRHEAAMLRWMEMEAAGKREGSLNAVIEQQKFPIPIYEG